MIDSVSFFFTTKKQDAEPVVDLFSLIKDYLVDQEDGIRRLITWFLNLVMEEEALLQSGAQRYETTDSHKASRNGYKPRTFSIIIWNILVFLMSTNVRLNFFFYHENTSYVSINGPKIKYLKKINNFPIMGTGITSIQKAGPEISSKLSSNLNIVELTHLPALQAAFAFFTFYSNS